jgi:hypothetical protein
VRRARSSGPIGRLTFANGAWTGPVTIGGAFSSDPSCVGLATGHAFCAALNADGRIAGAVFNGSAWSLLPAMKTETYSPVRCAPDHKGHAICAWIGPLHQVYVTQYSGTSWLAVLNIGGRA